MQLGQTWSGTKFKRVHQFRKLRGFLGSNSWEELCRLGCWPKWYISAFRWQPRFPLALFIFDVFNSLCSGWVHSLSLCRGCGRWLRWFVVRDGWQPRVEPHSFLAVQDVNMLSMLESQTYPERSSLKWTVGNLGSVVFLHACAYCRCS